MYSPDIPTNQNRDVVDLWLVDLDAFGAHARTWSRAVLSDDELWRADRLKKEVDRSRFVSARSILRALVGEWLGRDPESVRFIYGPFGKPELAGGGGIGLHFNLSHAEGWAMLALTTTGPVGIDIERVQEVPDWWDITQAWFSRKDSLRLADLPTPERRLAFAQLWTKREALLKAMGTGWSGTIGRSRKPAAPGVIVGEVPAPEGYAAAVAHRSGRARVAARVWTPEKTFEWIQRRKWGMTPIDSGAFAPS